MLLRYLDISPLEGMVSYKLVSYQKTCMFVTRTQVVVEEATGEAGGLGPGTDKVKVAETAARTEKVELMEAVVTVAAAEVVPVAEKLEVEVEVVGEEIRDVKVYIH